jgi:hypothetical protein
MHYQPQFLESLLQLCAPPAQIHAPLVTASRSISHIFMPHQPQNHALTTIESCTTSHGFIYNQPNFMHHQQQLPKPQETSLCNNSHSACATSPATFCTTSHSFMHRQPLHATSFTETSITRCCYIHYRRTVWPPDLFTIAKSALSPYPPGKRHKVNGA